MSFKVSWKGEFRFLNEFEKKFQIGLVRAKNVLNFTLMEGGSSSELGKQNNLRCSFFLS